MHTCASDRWHPQKRQMDAPPRQLCHFRQIWAKKNPKEIDYDALMHFVIGRIHAKGGYTNSHGRTIDAAVMKVI